MSKSPLESEAFQSEWPERPAGPPPPRHSRLSFLRELPVLIILAFALALGIKTFLIQAFYIPSASMEPTLHGCTGCNGDRVLVNKLAFRLREPRRGEIVVFVTGAEEARQSKKNFVGRLTGVITEGLGVTPPADVDFIKRIIGLSGDTIQITDSIVTITPSKGRPFKLKEPYISPNKDLSPFGPFTVPKGAYFVMGDNRSNSSDSRVNSFGICTEKDGKTPKIPCAVPKRRLVGKAFVRIWPFKRIHLFRDPGYDVTAGLVFLGLLRRRRRGVQPGLLRRPRAAGYPQQSWSPTAAWRRSCVRPAFASSPGPTKLGAVPSPGRSSPRP
jgi:signal peptidase I